MGEYQKSTAAVTGEGRAVDRETGWGVVRLLWVAAGGLLLAWLVMGLAGWGVGRWLGELLVSLAGTGGGDNGLLLLLIAPWLVAGPLALRLRRMEAARLRDLATEKKLREGTATQQRVESGLRQELATVTERLAALEPRLQEEQTRRTLAEQQFAALARMVREPLLVLDGATRVIATNHLAVEFWNHAGIRNLTGRGLSELSAGRLLPELEQALAGFREITCAVVLPGREKGRCPATAHAIPVTAGATRNWVVMLTLEAACSRRQSEVPPWLVMTCGSDQDSFFPQSIAMDAVLQGQLERMVKETESAAFSIISKVRGVDGVVDELMTRLDEIAAQGKGLSSTGNSAVTEDRTAIATMRNFVAEARTRRQEEQQRGEQVMKEIGGLVKFVRIVEEISDQTNVLALNARIIAARAREHGQQFGEVASEVRKLSAQVRAAAEQIGTGIAKSVESVGALFGHTHQGGDSSEERILATAADQMMRMGEHYSKLLDHNEGLVGYLRDWNRRTSTLVMELLGNIQFQDITRQQTEQVMKALRKRTAYVEFLLEVCRCRELPPQGEIPEFHVDQLLQGYVMAQQRAVHHHNTGAEGAVTASQAGGEIELF